MAHSSTFLGQSADEQFKHWAASHPEAFYINVKGRGYARLHRANCWHLGSGEGLDSASNSKICSGDAPELRQWARENGLQLEDCTHCLR